MPDRNVTPTQQKVDEVEQKVQVLKDEISERNHSDTTVTPTQKIKQQAEDLTTNPSKSPRKLLTIILLIGLTLLLIGILIIVFTEGTLLWILAGLAIVVILLSDRTN